MRWFLLWNNTNLTCMWHHTTPPAPHRPLQWSSWSSWSWPRGRKVILGGFCLGVIRQRHHQSWEGELQRVTMGDKIMSGATATWWGTARVPVLITWQRPDWLQTCRGSRLHKFNMEKTKKRFCKTLLEASCKMKKLGKTCRRAANLEALLQIDGLFCSVLKLSSADTLGMFLVTKHYLLQLLEFILTGMIVFPTDLVCWLCFCTV